MMKVTERIVPGWLARDGGYVYPAAEEGTAFRPWGFDRVCDQALDIMGWAGFACTFCTREAGCVRVQADFADGRRAHAELWLPAGEHDCFLSLRDFRVPESMGNIWRFLQRIEVDGAKAMRMTAMRARALAVDCPIRGRSARPGQTVRFEAEVANALDEAVVVQARQRCVGWEGLRAAIEPSVFHLTPGASQTVAVELTIPEDMLPGGHETAEIIFTPNGRSTEQAALTLHAMSRLEHPFIYHDRAGWEAAGRRGRELPQFQASYDAYLRAADAYAVAPPEQDKPYCYPTQVELDLMACAYAYGMTQNIAYARKIADFFRHFCAAYMARQRGCSQSYVQEGHFFQHLAICYDVIHDAGVLTEADHAVVEACFRLYMAILDQHLHNGHTSNWLLSEITGALYCAFSLQDPERVLRFATGVGGTEQQLIRGVFSDGWWFECSVSYNTWVSSMLLHTARVLRLMGIDWVHRAFPVSYSRYNDATWLGEASPVRFDMDDARRGGKRRISIGIKDVFDAPLPFLDVRGVLFGICDSYERVLEGVHFGSTYELAYQYYRDPRYVPLIRSMPMQDCVFGVEDLPQTGPAALAQNAASDNIGIAMLRSAVPGRAPLQQIQAVLRYGSHGEAHGHFDRASLLSVMRYGRSFFNPEHVWWGYPHFMYKFYVQNSMSKNMVVVDEKHQNVADSRLTLFATGKRAQAACVETEVTWSYPPYGGMVYDPEESLEARCRYNGCTLNTPEGAPPFGAVTGHTEPIMTRRLMVVTGDYIVLFDSLRGRQRHRFSNLFQIKGFEGLSGSLTPAGHTRRFSDDPLGDAQFVTDCHHYDAHGVTCARFCTVFGEGEDLRGTRSEHNEPGLLKMDVHAAWPLDAHIVMGLTAEDHHMYIPVRYTVEADARSAANGEFGAWLGCTRALHADVTGADTLTLRLQCLPLLTEQLDPFDSKQGLFLGDAVLTLADGTTRRLAELPLRRDNVDEGYGIGRDYEGGRVLLTGKPMEDAIPVSPIDHQREAVIIVDLRGLNAIRFDAELGADAFPGDEQQRRRTYATQTEGEHARFVTVVEPYEAEAMVARVHAPDANTVTVTLADGRVQTVRVEGLDDGAPVVRFLDAETEETLSGTERA